ncbi:glycine--tRNA ligase subunit beta [Sutcliffiella rhizosphaerae]|uniref:Glycine--tRNA ligase beta subunit n=1 Tax=Sutcliffiella rhizosphaerae TaxID=2880967 RepID=A0ABM8YHH2_9BACI|nr:glycine--tRNA ligase subunit beta [Sutcliffiella rhizosphaerae]CAG9619347.1 Glycine--tRNA ligase beta subunit [Sutcliffiella rhizosphaerae]
MSKRDFLFEIGLEEMPARFVTDSMNQLHEKVAAWLANNQLPYDSIRVYSTPRRLTVLVEGLVEKQEDVTLEAKGPAKKVALAENGEWSKAAQGFTRGQGLSVEDIYFKEINGVEYVHVQKHVKGKETKELLSSISTVATSLHFPKNMRWADEELRYVRPIKWLIALFGTEIIPVEIAKVVAGRKTFGHRFLGGEMELAGAASYSTNLLANYVIVDPVERKEAIRQQLSRLSEENGWNIPVDEDLLEEVNNLVEYPTALFGTFESEFLSLPEEVLITSMKEHQRYFPVKSKDGKLLPYFVTVRNGNHENLDIVARGNEKVLRARLSDAAFFSKEDKKLVIDEAVKKLDKIVFHEEIGTTGDKVRRVQSIALSLAKLLDMDEEAIIHLSRAASIYKFDLVSHMVYEFPELQGIMGEKYAIEKGESPEVAQAINEHYMPRSAEDQTASSDIGAVLSIAEKMDTIVSFFAIGVTPTGSQDPYALRRQASGIIQTLINKEWAVSIETTVSSLVDRYISDGIAKNAKENILAELLAFFKLRVKHNLSDRGIRYDIVDALLDLPLDNVCATVRKAETLNIKKDDASFKETMESFSRVCNIAKKATSSELVQESLLQQIEEQNLYNQIKEKREQITRAANSQQFALVYEELASLKMVIDEFFDNTMVMVDDEKIRSNRLALMVELADLISIFGNVNGILVK